MREFDAAQARIEQHAERVYDEKRRGLVLELLPVLDNLDRTLKATKPTSDAALVEGVRIVRAELEGVLTRYGVERVEASGQRFDPKLHEAVAAVPVLDPALVGTVVSQSAPVTALAAACCALPRSASAFRARWSPIALWAVRSL